MGGNGSFLNGYTNFEKNREYKTIFTIGDNIKILERLKKGVKLPEESHTPNRVYATYYRDGKGLKEVAEYGKDGKKIYEIHTIDHQGLGTHYHPWKNGRPTGEVYKLTGAMKLLLNKILNLKR